MIIFNIQSTFEGDRLRDPHFEGVGMSLWKVSSQRQVVIHIASPEELDNKMEMLWIKNQLNRI